MPRKIFAVVLGFASWSAIWVGYNAVLQWLGIISHDETQPVQETFVLVVLLVGSAVASLLAGYIAAAVVKKAAKPTVVALGLLLLSTGIFVQAQFWHLMPLWYHVAFLALLIPICIAGAIVQTSWGVRR